ncbi:hypothetical protein NM208_g1807 [Fusarium decemcellulare]|uniref:Uncharacterized protein n=1 Tax=Fusarium decemcellulare TaxID=57161 RepID=A0ACC1SUX9_9HYPO|nr:hypothetical protein NM208_g1807 [Fusarium decemcellulare]
MINSASRIFGPGNAQVIEGNSAPSSYLYQNNLDNTGDSDWFETRGLSASGLGSAKNVRLADIDGDELDDYIYLRENDGTIIYRSTFGNKGDPYWEAFYDIDGDGKADCVWTRSVDGAVPVCFNQYPNEWKDIGVISGDAGTSGNNIRFATLQLGGRADVITLDPNTGALGAWLNACDNLVPELVLKDKPPVCNKESDYPGHIEIKYAYTSWASVACEKKDITNNVGPRFKRTYTYHGEYNH